MTQDIGQLGEALVARWLCDQGWQVLHQRWACRWGEIDLIAQYPDNPIGQVTEPILSFVEVKTRQQRNWDADGLLAITARKQHKLWKTAQVFLAANPHLVDFTCRFDVALVRYQRSRYSPPQGPETVSKLATRPTKLTLDACPQQPVYLEGYQFILQTYLESAFIL